MRASQVSKLRGCRPTVALGMFLLLLALLCASTALIAAGGSQPEQPMSSGAPAPGTAQRRAILDALRAEVRRWYGLDVVFVVVALKVKDGWAWVHTRPQSEDVVNHYEDIVALMREERGAWRVLDLGEDATSRQRFPEAPAEFFP